MVFERRQMSCANDAARSDNPDPQFMIIFWRHVSNAISILRNRSSLTRDKFDRGAHSPFKIHLTAPPLSTSLRAVFWGYIMSKVCSITGSRAARGSVIHRRGMAKKKGGVGRHVTKNVSRIFGPNLHRQRIWVPELKKFVRIRVTARGLKTINKNGAYATLKKAGAI
jgi:large subunit ribosomal protein L28